METIASLVPLVVICTLDRPTELDRCLDSLAGSQRKLVVLVVDASASLESAKVCARPRQQLTVTRVQVMPGLSQQRNLGLDEARRMGVDVVMFIDDDVVCEPGYVDAVLGALARDPSIAAVGGVVVNEPSVSWVPAKAFFRLWSRRPGVVLSSGRNVIGHHPTGTFPRDVQWLSTCTASIRLAALGGLRFDERLVGYSYGEDLDLTFRLGRTSRLVVIDTARAAHALSPLHRPSSRLLARRRTVLLHAWVKENRLNGLRLRWFWWSVLGEILLTAAGTAVGHADDARRLVGVIEGCLVIWSGGSSRSYPNTR